MSDIERHGQQMRCPRRARIGRTKCGSAKLIKGHHRTGVGNLGWALDRGLAPRQEYAMARANCGLVAVSHRPRLPYLHSYN